uniref:Uncharacterized protein n=1 Tax=Alexandrium monilatum TaxID=311494 RepID=A0A7S4PTP1_9DINO
MASESWVLDRTFRVRASQVAGSARLRASISAIPGTGTTMATEVWTMRRSFRVHASQVDRLLLLDRHNVSSVTDAVSRLNSNDIRWAEGLCVVYSASHSAYYVLYQLGYEETAHARFDEVRPVAMPARLCAAKAVVSESMQLWSLAVLLYRLAEFSANVVLFSFMTWFVQPVLLTLLFVLLWYLPAVLHNGSFGKPLGYPLLNFVVDDFSFLNIHPTPRSAWNMYAIAAARVFLLLLMIPLLNPAWSPLPGSVLHLLAHKQVLDIMRERLADSKRVLPVVYLWVGLNVFVVVLSVCWLVVTLHMLLVQECRGVRSPIRGFIDAELLRSIGSLADEVEAASALEPSGCRREMQRLQETHPKLKIANFFSTFGPAWAVILHIGIDVVNIVSFATTGRDPTRAILLGLAVFITLCYAAQTARVGLRSLYQESVLSWERGLFTESYLAFVRADRGVQTIPALIIINSALPFTVTSAMASVGALGSVGIAVALVVPFICEQYDYGIERDGADRSFLQGSEVAGEAANGQRPD